MRDSSRKYLMSVIFVLLDERQHAAVNGLGHEPAHLL